VGKGSKTSVFRFGSVGPKIQFNLYIKHSLKCGSKGKMVKIPLLCDGRYFFGVAVTLFNTPFPLFGRRARQIYRIFLTRISNINSLKLIVSCKLRFSL